jgi:hypothetical protein
VPLKRQIKQEKKGSFNKKGMKQIIPFPYRSVKKSDQPNIKQPINGLSESLSDVLGLQISINFEKTHYKNLTRFLMPEWYYPKATRLNSVTVTSPAAFR